MARAATVLKLDAETWGDQLHRAYRQARDMYPRDPVTGEAVLSYRVVAEKMRAAGIDVGDQTLMRLEDLTELPTRMKSRQIAYFALLAYGYDPEDFGLNPQTVVLTPFDLGRIKRALLP